MKLRALIAGLLTCSVTAFSQAPAGQFTYALTNAPLWDFSGSYTNSSYSSFNFLYVLTVQFVHNANGKLTGSLSEASRAGFGFVNGSASVTGRAFWTSRSTGLIIYPYTEMLSGMVEQSPYPVDVPYSSEAIGHGRITLATNLLVLQSDGLGRLCPPNSPRANGGLSCQLPLPDGMTGNWTLTLQVAPQQNKLAGTATITLSNNRTLDYTVSGSYAPRREISTLRLAGYSETKGSSLLIKAQGPEMQLISVSGNILGQRVKF